MFMCVNVCVRARVLMNKFVYMSALCLCVDNSTHSDNQSEDGSDKRF